MAKIDLEITYWNDSIFYDNYEIILLDDVKEINL